MSGFVRNAIAWREMFRGLDPDQIATLIIGDLVGYSSRSQYKETDARSLSHAVRAIAANAAAVQAHMLGNKPGTDYLARFPEEARASADKAYEDGFNDAYDRAAEILGGLLKLSPEEALALMLDRDRNEEPASGVQESGEPGQLAGIASPADNAKEESKNG